MTPNPKLIAYIGIAFIFLALASKILNAETVSFSISPLNGIHITAEGSHPPPAQAQTGH